EALPLTQSKKLSKSISGFHKFIFEAWLASFPVFGQREESHFVHVSVRVLHDIVDRIIDGRRWRRRRSATCKSPGGSYGKSIIAVESKGRHVGFVKFSIRHSFFQHGYCTCPPVDIVIRQILIEIGKLSVCCCGKGCF